MKLFGRKYNFEDPKVPSIEEFKKMSIFEHMASVEEYRYDLEHRCWVEKTVLKCRRCYRYLTRELPWELRLYLEILLLKNRD